MSGFVIGDLGGIRTPSRQSRNLIFYPVELLGHFAKIRYKSSITIFLKIRSYLIVFIVLLLVTMRSLILILFPFFINAQDLSIGSWKDYQSYNSASYIAEADNQIYCVASGSLFYINKNDNTINRISKITGLSDFEVNQIAYSKELNTIIITYKNGNVDILKNNQIINIPDIKRKEIPTF